MPLAKQVVVALYNALEIRAGEQISEDVADAIVSAVIAAQASIDVDQSPVPENFPRAEQDGLTFQVERMRDVVEEIKPLHFAHWQETELYRHGQPFNPDYESFMSSERAGRYMLFTVRHQGELVGNCAVYVQRCTHTQIWVATEDTLFIRSDHRKGRVGIKFFRYCESILNALGVTEVRFSVKTVNRVWKAWQREGYAITAYEMTKQLKGSDDATQVKT